MAFGQIRISFTAIRAALSLLMLAAGFSLALPAGAAPLSPVDMSLERPEDAINARKEKGEARVGPLPRRVMTSDGGMGNQMFIANPNSVVQVVQESKTASLILKPWQNNQSLYDREIMNMGPLGRLGTFFKCNAIIFKTVAALAMALACWYFIYQAIDLFSHGTISRGYRVKAYAIFVIVAVMMSLTVFSFFYFDLGSPAFCR